MGLNGNPYEPQGGTIPARVLTFFRGPGFGREFATGVLADELGLDGGSLTACLATPRKQGALICENRAGLNYWRLGTGSARGATVAHAVLDEDELDDEPPVQRVAPARDGLTLLDIPRFPGVVVKASPAKTAPSPAPAPRGAPPAPKGPHAPVPLGWLKRPVDEALTTAAAALPFVDPDKAFERSDAQPQETEAAQVSQAIATPGIGKGHAERRPAPQEACAPAAPAVQQQHSELTWDNSSATERAARAMGLDGPPAPPAPMRFALWSDGTLQVEANRQLYATFSPDETKALVRYLERMCERGDV